MWIKLGLSVRQPRLLTRPESAGTAAPILPITIGNGDFEADAFVRPIRNPAERDRWARPHECPLLHGAGAARERDLDGRVRPRAGRHRARRAAGPARFLFPLP